jgi:hypothetical protein
MKTYRVGYLPDAWEKGNAPRAGRAGDGRWARLRGAAHGRL